MVTWRHLLMLIVFGLLLAASQSNAAAILTARLSTHEIELGKFVNLTLQYNQAAPALNSIDLSQLQAQFFIDPSAELTTTDQQQQWQLRLYPRRNGLLRIPTLTHGQANSTPLVLTVKSAIDHKTGHQLRIESSVSSLKPWLNQQVLLTLSVISKDKHIILHTTAPDMPRGRLYALPLQTELEKTGGEEVARHSIGWSYFPSQAGEHLFELPPVRYRRDGVDTHVFYLPRQKFQVQPLPLYVPRNLPVGRFSLQVATPASLMLTGRLQYLTLTLRGQGIQQTQLPPLQHHLQSQAGLSLYPADIRSEQTATAAGLISQAQLQIPFKAQATGIRQLMDINLSYFDDQDGKIKTLAYHWPRLFFIKPWLLGILGSIVVFICLYGLRRLLTFSLYHLQRYRTRRQAIQCLLAATNPRQIKQAIMLLNSLETGTCNTTLLRWQQTNDVDIEPLSQALYQQAGHDMQQLKQHYLRLCR